MRNKKIYKTIYFKIIPSLIIGFCLGVISIWPGIVSGDSRKCFHSFIKDSMDGSVKVKTLLSINPNYLVKIKNTKNNYLKVLLIGDSCFRKF